MPPNPTPPRCSSIQPQEGGAGMAVERDHQQAAAAGEEAFEEVDPTGRFGRYADVLGLGSVKKVYRGFDQEGIEVAWNRVRLRALADRDPGMVERLHAEVRLLRSLHHEHIIGFHKVWLDRDAGVLNFITEVCTSGSLREYRQRHRHVSVKALKKWARQILEGLNHLHTHDPCIIHRDLNCSNVFINGNNGQVKIGDLGLAAIVDKTHVAHTILGTPEFMAPELYTETYTESVDIYSYGMCVLEMVTREVPYAECGSVVQIFHNVTRGVPPAALKRLKDLSCGDSSSAASASRGTGPRPPSSCRTPSSAASAPTTTPRWTRPASSPPAPRPCRAPGATSTTSPGSVWIDGEA